MTENHVTQEMMDKARQADSAAQLLAMARENGVEMTEERAQEVFDSMHSCGELADDELDNVSGGCDEIKHCARCGELVRKNDSGRYRCQNCGYYE